MRCGMTDTQVHRIYMCDTLQHTLQHTHCDTHTAARVLQCVCCSVSELLLHNMWHESYLDPPHLPVYNTYSHPPGLHTYAIWHVSYDRLRCIQHVTGLILRSALSTCTIHTHIHRVYIHTACDIWHTRIHTTRDMTHTWIQLVTSFIQDILYKKWHFEHIRLCSRWTHRRNDTNTIVCVSCIHHVYTTQKKWHSERISLCVRWMHRRNDNPDTTVCMDWIHHVYKT